jgi:catechol 2,3-dioxygenase-like lactoylglutathione lyase family enzyme
MKRVTGIGGIFFKSTDPRRSARGTRSISELMYKNGVAPRFDWKGPDNPEGEGTTAWSLFAADTDHFAPSSSPFMINYRVDDLPALLAALRAEGVQVDEKVEESEFGKFGWVIDPEGNKVELWQPPAGQ